MLRRTAMIRIILALLALGWFVFERSVTLDLPAPGRVLVDRDGRFLARLAGPAGHGYWPMANVPERLRLATLAAEDRRIGHHPGVDVIAVGRAMRDGLAAGRVVSGASTLAMQLARLQNPGRHGLTRKAMEAVTAIALTHRYGPDAIVSAYLTCAPYGNNTFGAAAAADLYFGKPLAALDWAETAFLAGLPQAPGASNPYRAHGLARARARAAVILGRLHGSGLLTDENLKQAQARLATLSPRPFHLRPAVILPLLPRLATVTQGRSGRVTLSLDLNLLSRIQPRALAALAPLRAAGAQQAAVIVARLSDRQVLAWLPNADPDGMGGATDFGAQLRSPGSTLKPFIFGLALQRGLIALDRSIADRPLPVALRNVDGVFLGDILPGVALANSRNLPAAALVAQLGEAEVLAHLDRLNLAEGRLPGRAYGLSLAVGAMPARLDRLVAAYAMLGDNGILRPLSLLKTDASPGFDAMPPPIAAALRAILADPQARLPSFGRMGGLELHGDVALKTGTSQGARDAFAFAVSRDHAVGVWLGRADHGPMPGLTGGNAAAPLARAVLLMLEPELADGLSDHAQSAAVSARPQPSQPQLCRIESPGDGIQILRNPDVPADAQKLRLAVIAPGSQSMVNWRVDGLPLATVPANEAAFWLITPGQHVISADCDGQRLHSKIRVQ